MTLGPGTKLGPYEIAASLGAGGMGEVYRARDPRIGRDVALKVLPASLSGDADRLRRFEQEARATGLLNHPNILAVFDVGAALGVPYVVSELLEGDTLRGRIGGTPLPVRKAIDYGCQIALGLAAAHEKGVVHRDLKPENVFVTNDGRVKILDFGLAKLVAGDALTEGETHTQGGVGGTDAGTVLGTVGYMSPEQVRARPVDHRSDIFSFGSVLYEMLSGRRAFHGASSVETLNAILKEDPAELSQTNRQLPPALERIVSHCLEKNPEERFQSARDIAFDLEQLTGASGPGLVAAPLPRAAHLRTGLLLAGFAAALAVAFALGRNGSRRRDPAFERLTFRREQISAARFAPDGRTVIYESTFGTGRFAIFAAQMGSTESRSLGLDDARLAGVSTTGELAVLLKRGEGLTRTLARLPLSGGAPRDVVEDAEGADWSPDGASMAVLRWTGGGLARLEFPPGKQLVAAPSLGRIRFSPRGDRIAFTEHPFLGDNRGDVAVVDLQGQKAVLSSGWADLGSLAWSADGSEVLFTGTRRGAEHSVYAVSLEGKERLVYKMPGSVAVRDVAADGRILLAVGQNQPRIQGRGPGEAQERDLSWLDFGVVAQLTPDAKRLLFDEEGLGGGPEYSAYLRGMNGSPPARLGNGKALALSPDSRWALVHDLRSPTQLVLLPTGAGQPRPLARGRIAQFQDAVFSMDSTRVYLAANEAARDVRLWEQDIAGGDPRPLTDEGVAGRPGPDGKRAVIYTPQGLQLLDLGGGHLPRPLKGALPGDDLVRFAWDGRSLIVRAADRGVARLFRIDLETGRRVPLREIGPGEGSSGTVRNLDISDDGQAYAYSYADPSSTLYLAQGLR